MNKATSMGKIILLSLFILIVVMVLVKWIMAPSLDAVAFIAPPKAMDFKVNTDLDRIEVIDLNGSTGPEDIVVGAGGHIYTAMENGDILRISADHQTVERFLNTGGRPLGLAFDHDGNLIIADPFVGLLRVTPDKQVETLIASSQKGIEVDPALPKETLCYANNVDVAADGTLYFTDSSARFCPPDYNGTYEASQFDIIEHQSTGRFMSYDPKTKKVSVLATGIQFANGVALSPDGQYALIAETGNCRILRYSITGDREGELTILIDGLAGYPDNLTRGLDGRYWLGFTKPRSQIIEKMAGLPLLREVMFSILPKSLRPIPAPYGHIMAIDINGNIVARHQDPDPHYPDTTGATETDTGLYVHSLHAQGLGVFKH